MNKNKILYRPRTADPSTLTTSGLDPPLPTKPRSVHQRANHHALPARKHTTTGISQHFGTSQPTISRAINTVLNILDVVLPSPPRPKDLSPQRLYMLDGMLVPCWWWKNARNLYSGKHHKAGHNLQVLTDQAGEIFYISEPLPGSTHDITAIRNTEAYSVIRKTGDKGHRYLASITSIAANANTPPAMRTA